MKLRSEKDFWSGLVFIAAGAGFAVGSLGDGFGSRTAPGPGLFPVAAGALAAGVGAALLFKSLALETEGGERIGPWAIVPLMLIAVAMISFAWTLPQLGLFVAVPGLVLFSALAVGAVQAGALALQLVVLTAAAFGLFVWVLHAAVPLWS